MGKAPGWVSVGGGGEILVLGAEIPTKGFFTANAGANSWASTGWLMYAERQLQDATAAPSLVLLTPCLSWKAQQKLAYLRKTPKCSGISF